MSIRTGLRNFSLDYIFHSDMFTPADFYPYTDCIECIEKYGYHICMMSPSLRMHYTASAAKNKKYYDKLKDIIQTTGLLAPLSAKVSNDQSHYVLVDGHTRLSIAKDLDIKNIMVYVSKHDADIHDLVAGDSGWWTEGVDSPWLGV